MKKQLQKAIDLAALTGDKIIVVDEKTDQAMVVMNIDEYEKLIISENKRKRKISDLTEEDLLDKINHDIISWKNANEEKEEDFCGNFNFNEELDDEDEYLSDSFEDNFSKFIPEEEEDENSEKNELKEENFYYYEEPPLAETSVDESAFAKASVNESAFAKASVDEPEKEEKRDNGFTSIKDEIKSRKNWEIPPTIKERAEEIKEIPF